MKKILDELGPMTLAVLFIVFCNWLRGDVNWLQINGWVLYGAIVLLAFLPDFISKDPEN